MPQATDAAVSHARQRPRRTAEQPPRPEQWRFPNTFPRVAAGIAKASPSADTAGRKPGAAALTTSPRGSFPVPGALQSPPRKIHPNTSTAPLRNASKKSRAAREKAERAEFPPHRIFRVASLQAAAREPQRLQPAKGRQESGELHGKHRPWPPAVPRMPSGRQPERARTTERKRTAPAQAPNLQASRQKKASCSFFPRDFSLSVCKKGTDSTSFAAVSQYSRNSAKSMTPFRLHRPCPLLRRTFADEKTTAHRAERHAKTFRRGKKAGRRGSSFKKVFHLPVQSVSTLKKVKREAHRPPSVPSRSNRTRPERAPA